MTTSSVTSSSSLDPSWVTLIEQTMKLERQQRLDRLTEQRDELDVRKAIYTDLKNTIQDLQTQISSLTTVGSSSTDRTVNMTGSGLTATASSTATEGAYKIEISSLASKHRLASAQQSSSSSALNLTGSIQLNGATINVNATDTLYTLASNINSASYTSGKNVTASVVDNRLVLESSDTGTAKTIDFSGNTAVGPLAQLGVISVDGEGVVSTPALSGTGGGQLSAATDAKFTVNGLEVTRSSNSSITDVITGVTLNLTAKTEADSPITLNITTDDSSVSTNITNFVSKFNALQSYLQDKTGSKKVDETHYTRGSLANDFGLRSLRGDLAQEVMFSASNSGSIKSLADIGLELDDELKLKVADQTKVDDALGNHFDDLKSFLSAKMTSLNTYLDSYTSSQGMVSYSIESFETQKEDLESKIEFENNRLEIRQQALTAYYESMNTVMNELLATQKQLGALGLYGFSTKA